MKILLNYYNMTCRFEVVYFCWLVLGMLIANSVNAQPVFLEQAEQKGITACNQEQTGWGLGLVSADYDNDGDIDLFLPTPDGSPNRVYQNQGNGSFQDVAAAIGLASTERARAGLWFDYNADNRLDLLVTSDCFRSDCNDMETVMRLYRQEVNGQFSDTTAASGLLGGIEDREIHRSGAAVGDLNEDGFLDLVTGFWEGELHLYMNQKDGTFSDVTLASGIGADSRGNWQPVIIDFNGDDRLDIALTVDFSENKLWINQGTINGVPVMVESAGPAACDNAMNDMGLALGDFDDDGDPDIYATNIYREEFDQYNVLLRNDSNQTASCTEISGAAGVRNGGWGWGTTFLDVDNDTYLDLAETNGWHLSGWEQPARLYMNQPTNSGVFVDQAQAAGLTATHWGSTLLAIDIERDGDLDLVERVSDACASNRPETIPLSIYTNQLDVSVTPHNYLVIKPRINGLNHWAIGAKIEAIIGQRTLTRWITAGTSFLGQEPAEAFFGLSDINQVDQIIITWPNGEQTITMNVAVNQSLTITQTPVLFVNGFE